MVNEELLSGILEEFVSHKERIFTPSRIQTLSSRVNYVQEFFSANHLQRLLQLSEEDARRDIQGIGNVINGFSNNTLAKKRAFGKPNHPIAQYVKTFHYLAYGKDDIATRINNILNDSEYKLFGISESSLGEIVGLLFSDKYVLCNEKDIKGAERLGASLYIKNRKNFGEFFVKYNESVQEIIALYKEQVGRLTELPIGLEIDQLFSYVIDQSLAMTLSTLSTKRLGIIVDAYINEYITWRNSDAWDEKYKRDTLPNIAKLVFSDERTKENVVNKIDLLNKNKKNRVSYMGNISDLQKIAENYPDDFLQARQKLLKDEPTNTVGTRIDKFLKKVKELGIKSNLGTPMFGYLFAAQHPEKYPLYKDEIFQYAIKGIVNEGMTKKLDKGGKYQLFVELCNTISTYMQVKQYPLHHTTKEPVFSGSIMDAQDFLYFIHTFDKMSTENLGGAIQQLDAINALPKNTILYGVPGTGKTYATITYAVAIIENKSLDEIRREDRSEVKSRYEQYRADGQIVFTTFHQSYGYEDFVEGVKAEVDNGVVSYNVVDGVLKEICSLANAENVVAQSGEQIDVDAVNIFKMSLGVANQDEEIYEYCMQNNVVALGFAKHIDFSRLPNTPEHNKAKPEITKFLEEWEKTSGIQIDDKFLVDGIYRFKNWIQNGDLVFISNGNSKLRAIGQVVGDYFFDEATEIDYTHFRKVNWLLKDVDIPVAKIQSKKFSQQAVYNLKDDTRKKTGLYLDVIKELLGQGKQEQKNYVLVIDEINRGNISKIFGELITLLEDDKRGGAKEALTVMLPYSKKQFSIPNNLYVIGTMNTADRSIALMDLALRRRFYFQEVHPDSSLLEGIEVEGINIKQLFETINNRIEYLYDADHRLGHAFFLPLKENAMLSHLNHIFLNKIIPLLQEYFYDDYEKIQIVLGDHSEQGFKDSTDNFIIKHEKKEQNVLGFDYEGAEESKATYVINSALINGTLSSNAYKGIYATTKTTNA